MLKQHQPETPRATRPAAASLGSTAGRVARRIHILNARVPVFKRPAYLKAYGGAGKKLPEDPATAAPVLMSQGGSKLFALTALMATMAPNPNLESLFTSIISEFDAEPDRA